MSGDVSGPQRDALVEWDYWHDKVCDIPADICSRHQTGAWPHLVDDALTRRWRPPTEPTAERGVFGNDIAGRPINDAHDAWMAHESTAERAGECAVPSCRYNGTNHAGPHKEIDGEREFWDDSTRPGYLRHRAGDAPTTDCAICGRTAKDCNDSAAKGLDGCCMSCDGAGRINAHRLHMTPVGGHSEGIGSSRPRASGAPEGEVPAVPPTGSTERAGDADDVALRAAIYEVIADHGGPCPNEACTVAVCLLIRDLSAILAADAGSPE